MNSIRGIFLFLLSVPMCGLAAANIPAGLVGIWATKGAVFKGELLFRGEAIYVDTDGIGAVIVGDDSDILGQRFEVRSWDETSQTLTVDLTEAGKTVDSGKLVFDHEKKTLAFSRAPNIPCERRFEAISASTRANLGLETKKR